MTTDETRKAKSKLAVLSASLQELESQLDPLFSQTFSETLLALEPIQQAKLQTTIPYVVYDLIFIYLKSRGIDPKTHPVIAELDRIRQYFNKIKDAENPPTRTTQVDKAAASRFIKHAITQAQIDSDASAQASSSAGPSNPALKRALSSIDREDSSVSRTPNTDAESSGPKATPLPVKITSKMIERAEYEKRIREAGSEEDDVVLVYDEGEGLGGNGDDQADEMEVVEEVQNKGKGKEKAVEIVQESTSAKVAGKRRRPAIDPFAASDADSTPPPTKKQALDPSSLASENTSSPSPAATPASSQPKKAKKKKGKKTAEVDSMDTSVETAAAINASMVDSTTVESQAVASSSPRPSTVSTKKTRKKKAVAEAEAEANTDAIDMAAAINASMAGSAVDSDTATPSPSKKSKSKKSKRKGT
ncbi:hypothetical protein VKT23_005531 [Stygiomarasmius scandens]|uniref:Exosome complex protein n=1 Tax=Marasmiellus scandens TaxID=2682957 RepID=A0ABR1JTQ1_9AGAR